MKSFKKGLKNYTNFSGRTTRKDYWMFMLFCFILSAIAMFLDILTGTFDEASGYGLIGAVLQLALFLPMLAIGIRRNHDANRSGWFVLLPFYNIYLLFVSTYSEENDWGPVPTSITESTQYDGNEKNYPDLESKLQEVKTLLEKGLLTKDEAAIRRKKIISEE